MVATQVKGQVLLSPGLLHTQKQLSYIEQMNNTHELNLFVFVPLPPQISQPLATIQDQLGYHLYINGPHVTIYHCRFTEELFKELVGKLSQTSFSPIQFNLGEIEVHPSKEQGSFYSLEVTGNELHNFHKQIINIANPLRGDLQRSKDQERIDQGKYSSNELAHILKYGYLNTLDRYSPHLTLADGITLTNEELGKLQEEIKPLSQNITPTHFVVQLQTYDGQYHIVEEVDYSLSTQ
jgi:hypothetical protein